MLAFLNPIEKVWRKLKQEILHLHRYSSRWKDWQERVDAWLIQYDRPAPDLLHYVGLSPSSFVKVHNKANTQEKEMSVSCSYGHQNPISKIAQYISAIALSLPSAMMTGVKALRSFSRNERVW